MNPAYWVKFDLHIVLGLVYLVLKGIQHVKFSLQAYLVEGIDEFDFTIHVAILFVLIIQTAGSYHWHERHICCEIL